jgi:hypothetical protein
LLPILRSRIQAGVLTVLLLNPILNSPRPIWPGG